MFGLFGPEKVTFLELCEGVIAFVSSSKRAGSSKIRLMVPDHPKPKSLDLPVYVFKTRRNTRGKGHVCVANIELDEPRLAKVAPLITTISVPPGLELLARRTHRLPTRLKVLCRELPGFSAVTADFGGHGVRLMTHGPVNEGTYSKLSIELDVGSMASQLNVAATAVWCAPDPQSKGGKGCYVGFAFTDVDDPTWEHINAYLKSLEYRLAGDVMHRSIADGEMFIRPDDNISK
jgi:hypothetical protein